jgi:hypothetical protein
MKYLLRWLVPASALEGEWTQPAPGNFEYQMMMLRENIRRFQVALYQTIMEAARRFLEVLGQ